MRLGLVWFRNDLRIRDNEALARACAESDRLAAVYVWPERLFGAVPIGYPRLGARRARFIQQALDDLAGRLGVPLLRSRGEPGAVLAELADACARDAADTAGRDGERLTELCLYYQVEPFPEEHGEAREAESMVGRACAAHGIAFSVRAVVGQTLFHDHDLPFAPERMPKVYSDFRKAVERGVPVRGEWELGAGVPAPSGAVSRLAGTPRWEFRPEGIDRDDPPDERAAFFFDGGEQAAWRRLSYYFWESTGLWRYKQTRNGLVGPDYSSKFSPWLAHGVLSPRSIHREVRRFETDRGRNQSTYWLIFELIWRDYFHFLARRYAPDIFLPHGPMRRAVPWRRDRETFLKWVRGATGEPFIDANMRELAATGYMSNRGRQNVASYLAHHLAIDWTWGAQYFESVLLDYDPANNWGNWSYVAGVGTDPRRDRVFNPRVQAETYDPAGEYVSLWLH